MKIFHLGLCVSDTLINEMQKSFMRNCEYRELNCGIVNVNVNERAIQIVKEFKPDLVFMQIQAADIIHPNTVSEFKKQGAKVFNWTGDVRNSVPKWMYDVNCDLTLFSNMRDVKEMRSKGFKSEYLEIGYDENIYCPEGDKIVTKDIVFFGNSYGNKYFPLSQFRIDMVNFLKATYGNRFGVYGTGWVNADGNFNHSQFEEAKAYRGAKISINCSHYEIEKYSSDRMLRILGTGVPVCLAKHYTGIEEDYTNMTDLAVWKDLKGLKYLCDYYLQNEVERKFIVENGNKLVKSKFTFDHQIKNIIKIYNEL